MLTAVMTRGRRTWRRIVLLMSSPPPVSTRKISGKGRGAAPTDKDSRLAPNITAQRKKTAIHFLLM